MQPKRERGEFSMRRALCWIAGLCLLVGLVLLLYQPVEGWLSRHEMDQAMEEFQQVLSSPDPEDGGEQPPHSQDETGDQESMQYPQLWADMQAYNAEIYQNGQSGLVDAWSYEQSAFDLEDYGLPTDVVGVIRIPAMAQELPIYLGATQANMAKGAVVLGQTSMPVGGLNTNCVIAGHRGYGNAAFFRDIEVLQPGDYVYLTTYWGEKTYQVDRISIILPDDMEAVLIQEGRELLTLITCHPYVVGTHRYVVYCTPVEGEPTQTETDEEAQEPWREGDSGTIDSTDQRQDTDTYSQQQIQLERWLPYLAIPLVIVAIGLLLWPKKKEKQSPGTGKEKKHENKEEKL